jgi:hypothetical protein
MESLSARVRQAMSDLYYAHSNLAAPAPQRQQENTQPENTAP